MMEKYNQSIVIHPLFHLAATSSELPNLKAAFFGRHPGRCGKHFLQVLSVLCVPYLLNLYIKIFGLGSGFKCSMGSEQVRNNPSARSPALFFLAEAIMAVAVVVVVVIVAADVGVRILALLSSCSCWCRWPEFSLVFLYLCLLVDNHFFPQSYGKRQQITQ